MTALSSRNGNGAHNGSKTTQNSANGRDDHSLVGWVKNLISPKQDTSLRETIEEYIEVSEEKSSNDITNHERVLLSNILELRDIPVSDVMVPRADIVALEIETSHEEILNLLAEKQYNRFPVYRKTLDNVVGTVSIKSILACLAQGKDIHIKDMLADIPIVAPSLPVLDLLLRMRENKRHMVLVVDEFGGIDGLVNIGDIVETIVGEIDDEHDGEDRQPQITEGSDGSIIADARYDLEDFEDRFGHVFLEDELEESDTLGGLVSYLAGRVPARGEILTHDTGMVFEILDADPRRVNRLRIRNIPTAQG